MNFAGWVKSAPAGSLLLLPRQAQWGSLDPSKGHLLPRAATAFWESPVFPKTWVTLQSQQGNYRLVLSKKIFGVEVDEVKVLMAQLCLTLCNPMDCSPPGSSVHGILQARILEWVSVPFSSRSSQRRDWTWASHTAGRFFTFWATLGSWIISREFRSPFSRLGKTEKFAMTWLSLLLQSHDCTFLPLKLQPIEFLVPWTSYVCSHTPYLLKNMSSKYIPFSWHLSQCIADACFLTSLLPDTVSSLSLMGWIFFILVSSVPNNLHLLIFWWNTKCLSEWIKEWEKAVSSPITGRLLKTY